MRKTILSVIAVLGIAVAFSQTTQKIKFEDIAVPIYFKFRNDYSEVRMSAAAEEPTPYLDVIDSYIKDECIYIYIQDTDGTELILIKCEDNSAALIMADDRIYSGWVLNVTHH